MKKNIFLSIIFSILYLVILIVGYLNPLNRSVYLGGIIGMVAIIVGYFISFISMNKAHMNKVFYVYLIVALLWSAYGSYYLWGHLTAVSPRRIVGLVFLCITMVGQYALVFEFLRGRIKIDD